MRKFIYILFLQLGLLSANGQILNSNSYYKTKTTDNGLVFIDGTPISPPYYFEIKDSNVYVNGINIYQYKWSYNNDKFGNKYYNELPSLPVDVDKNTDFNILINAIPGVDSYSDESYIRKVSKYYYSHYEFDTAKEKVFEFIKKLPNVKEIIKIKDSYLIRPYNGESFFFDRAAGFWMEYNQKYYHKINIDKGVDDKKNQFDITKESVDIYFNELDSKETIIMFFLNPRELRYCSINCFEEIIDVCSKSISLDEKIERLLARKIAVDTITARKIIENYKAQPYINKYIEKVKKEGENNNDCPPLIRKNNNPCKDKSSLSISPYDKTYYAACPVPDMGSYNLHFADEMNNINSNIVNQDFFHVISFQDNAWDDNGYGNLTYIVYKNIISNGSFILLVSHGSVEEGIALIYMKDIQCIKDWLGYSNSSVEEIFQNENIIIKQTESINWTNNTKPYVAVATPEWFNTNWACNIDDNKSIVILSICYSYQNGCVQACTNGNGGVVFGYKNSTNYYQSNSNNNRLLKRMNGTTGNGIFRSATLAFNNMSKEAGFSMHPNNADVTLCPAPKSYTTTVSDFEGDAYFEIDTYCDANQDANAALVPTIESGFVQIGNREWVDVVNGKSKKIKFHYFTDSNFRVKMNVNPEYIKSYSNVGQGHRLDFDKRTPIEPNPFYYFEKINFVPTVNFSYQQQPNTLDVQFNASSNLGANVNYTWNFGDESNVQAGSGVVHTFPNDGVFAVKLTASKNNLVLSTTKYVLVINNSNSVLLSLSCSFPNSPNINENTTTIANIIGGYEAGHQYRYFFEVTDNYNTNYSTEVFSSSSFESFDYNFLFPGIYKIRIYVCDVENNSISGECETILSVNNPNPCNGFYSYFYHFPIHLYDEGVINFTTHTIGGTPPYTWRWNFYPDIVWGIEPQHGSKLINGMFYANGNTSNYYGSSGTYPVELIVTDWNGCVSQFSENINILSTVNYFENFNLVSSIDPMHNSPIRIKLKDENGDMIENYCPVHIVPMLNGMYGLNYLQSFAPYTLTNMDWYIRKKPSGNYILAEHITSNNISDGGIIHCDYTYPFSQSQIQISNANAVNFDYSFYQHPFDEQGNYSVKLRATFNDDNNVSFVKEAYTDVDVIKCNLVSYFINNNFSNSIVTDSYIASGKFYLNSNINSYINQHEINLLACNEIVFDNGFETGNKNFSAGGDEIEPCWHVQAGKKDTSFIETKQEIESKLAVYPNPFNQYITLYIKTTDTSLTSFTLYNSLGIEMDKKYYSGSNTLIFDTQLFPSGLYFLEVKNKKLIKTFKLIKLNTL
jgi:hypothetical protein